MRKSQMIDNKILALHQTKESWSFERENIFSSINVVRSTIMILKPTHHKNQQLINKKSSRTEGKSFPTRVILQKKEVYRQ